MFLHFPDLLQLRRLVLLLHKAASMGTPVATVGVWEGTGASVLSLTWRWAGEGEKPVSSAARKS